MRDIRQPNAAKGRQRSIQTAKLKTLVKQIERYREEREEVCSIHGCARKCPACADDAADYRRER